jgi:ABC-2 type transport system ATP-binding protein
MNVLKVEDLTKHFIDKKGLFKKEPKITKAVDGISFEINEGEIVGLLGPNGAGKTTTTQMLLGTLTPDRGKVSFFGKDLSEHRSEILKKVNFSSAYIDLPYRMTVLENLDVYARIYEVDNKKERIEKFLKEFEVLELKNKKFIDLSSGQKTRVLLSKAFLNHPKIILLDEPTASLDPDIALKVREFLLKQQEEHKVSMLFTSHNMAEVQEICDRIIFLSHGKIIAQDTPMGLVNKLKKTKIKMIISQGKQTLEKYLKNNKIKFYWKKQRIVFNVKEEDIPKILYQLSDQGVRYAEIEILRPTLEDYFLEVANK